MSHKTDIGYELQSSLLVSAEAGQPLSVAAQNLCSKEGVWQSRRSRQPPSGQTHLDELSEKIKWLEAQDFGARLVHIIDREADSVGHLRESWQQESARATFNRILIASQACAAAWALAHASGEEAQTAREFLVRLSGRQMKRSRPVTIPALLDGLFKRLTMLETLERYSLDELKAFAKIAKVQLNI